MSDDIEADDIRRGLNPIQAAIDTLSIPAGWRLQQITYLPHPVTDGATVVAIYAPTALDKFATVAGRGTTADEALRDAQRLVWERWEESK